MMARTENPHEDRPLSAKAAALSALLGVVALMGFSSAVQLVAWVIFVDDFVWDSAEGRRVMIVLPVSLLIGGAALWGLIRLKPWNEPMSPATRRTNKLFGLSGLISVGAPLALIYGTFSREDPLGTFWNSPVSIGIAVVAISFWLLSNAIAWWWYISADEHERRANDFGFLAAGGLFLTVTPVWWIAARAGLLPQPDAMILWLGFGAVIVIGWFWHRSR